MSSDLERFRDHARHMARARHRLDCDRLDEDGEPCGGCIPPHETALWWQLHDEINAYFAGQNLNRQLNRQSDEALFL